MYLSPLDIMYDSLKIGGQTAPQLHIVYSKVNIK